MTAQQALAEVRRRLEARRDDYLQTAERIKWSSDTEGDQRRANEMLASCISEALVELGEVEKKLSVKGNQLG